MLKIDGHDNAILGVTEVNLSNQDERLVYSFNIIIQNLKDMGMDYHEAVEFYDFNIGGAYVGEGMPLIVCDWSEDEN